MGINLTNLYIDETFPLLVQTSGSVFTDGTGSLLTQVDITASNAVSSSYALTASYALNSVPQVSASHAVNADTASLLIGNAEGVGHIDFINTAETTIERRLNWNDTDGTLNIGLKGGNVTLQVGQEEVARVVNGTGADLLEAQYRAVKVIGAQGQRLQVDLAQADSDINSATTIGIVTEDIAKNQEGFITSTGTVNKINTTGNLQGETWNDGDILYLSPTTPGVLTNVKPLTPAHLIVIGFVEYAHQNNGKIYVKVDNGYELEELHDVLITNPTNGEALVYENGIWINSDVPHVSASYAVSSSQAENANTATSASYALTASYAENSIPAFPFTGSAEITGSLTLKTLNNPGFKIVNPTNPGNYIQMAPEDGNLYTKNTFNMGAEKNFFQSPGDLTFNTSWDAGSSGSINFISSQDIDLQASRQVGITATDTVNIISNTSTPYQGISFQAPNVRVNLSSTGSTSGDFAISGPGFAQDTPGMLLSLGTGSYGSNPTTANMLFTGDDAFFSAVGNFYIKNVYNDTGSIQVWSENALSLRGDTYVKITGDEFAGQTVPVDIQGEAFAYTISSNINGFSNQVDNLSKVRNNQRAYVETPLIVGSQGTIEVSPNSTLKVINEL